MKLTILAIILALSLVACQQYIPTGASSAGAVTYTFADQAIGLTAISQGAVTNLSVINGNGTLNTSITIYGHNATGAFNETIQNITNATQVSVEKTWSIDCLLLNQSSLGGFTVSDYTGATVATFNNSNTLALNSYTFNGSNYGCPVARNSTVVDVSTQSEYALYLTCEATTAKNITTSYFVSPDSLTWYTGSVAISTCNGTSTVTPLTDKGLKYVKFQISNPDTKGNKINAKLVYK